MLFVEYMARLEFGLSGREWAAESKQDRVRAIAFLKMKQKVDVFMHYRAQMKDDGTTLARWLDMREEVREMKIDNFDTARRTGAFDG